MFSAPQARAGVPTGRQSVLPTVRGVPWWGAVLVALVPTAVGALVDAGGRGELSTWFRVLYFVGCVAAVLAVRRKALFTAVTQPPLIAFGVALVTLYSLEADASSGVKGLVINVMLPIAKAFPLMAWTFVVVGLLGAARWYLTRGRADATPQRTRRRAEPGRRAAGSRRASSERAPRRAADDSSRRGAPDRGRRAATEPPRRRAAADAPQRRSADPSSRRSADQPGRRASENPRRAPESPRRRDTPRRPDEMRRPAEPGVVARETLGNREPYRPARAEPPIRRSADGGRRTSPASDVPSAPRARYRGV
ncbi:DUF6542 domain-containing protein [Williamsia serinedens]|uniref:DUF6542 domain-containing protein n=1 Tax=Williamsia serinedens TaxID=391736 RepID=A0ABT1H385_9NOCA|nr:DUF6542 domain-containing protein [Williamsia serinedens]MCP2161202.1 hypothetical protein [Williamsia serinedens]